MIREMKSQTNTGEQMAMKEVTRLRECLRAAEDRANEAV